MLTSREKGDLGQKDGIFDNQIMNKIFSFFAGALCGALVGGVTALLLTPASGNSLKEDAQARWQEALREANLAMEEKRQELETQFSQASRG